MDDAINPDELIDYESIIDRNRANGWDDLDPKRKAFALEYLANGHDHRAAAEKTGFGASRGMRLLREPLTNAYIDHVQNAHYSGRLITKQFVTSQYMRLLPMLMGDEEINIVLSNGAEMTGKKFHAASAVSVLRDLAKATGYISDVNAEPNDGLVEVLRELGERLPD